MEGKPGANPQEARVEDRRGVDGGAAAELARTVSIASISDIRRAALAYRDAVAGVGKFRIITSSNIASRHPMTDAEGDILASSVFGFVAPEDRWWEQPQKALGSPLLLAARYEALPFWMNSDGFHSVHRNSALDAIDLAGFERRSRVGTAIVVPIHLPFGQIAMAALGTHLHQKADLSDVLAQHADYLLLISRHFLSSYVNVTRGRQWIPSDCHLSRRQIQCLQLVSAGATGAQMARIVGCSHSTVRYHLREASERLQAVSLTQAVFKAGQLGYLDGAHSAAMSHVAQL